MNVAFGPFAPHMSAFGGKADIVIRSRMSAFDSGLSPNCVLKKGS
jgi:hypothetical protein